MGKRRLVFSVPRNDLTVQTFRSGGPGGQHQNKSETGVRIIHEPSGARGESRSERSQYSNRQLALERLVASETFQKWARLEVARLESGQDTIDAAVAAAMNPRNIKIEVVRPDGQWEEVGE